MAETDRLIIGVGGHVVGIDTTTGREMWRTRLKGSSVVTVSTLGKRTYAATGGELFCVDSWTGRVLWHNKLKGLGLGVVTLPGGDAIAPMLSAEAKRQGAGAG